MVFFNKKITNMYMASKLASEPVVSHKINNIGRIRLKYNIMTHYHRNI